MLLNVSKGMLIEYALSLPPLALQFEFNPENLSRTGFLDGIDAPISKLPRFQNSYLQEGCQK